MLWKLMTVVPCGVQPPIPPDPNVPGDPGTTALQLWECSPIYTDDTDSNKQYHEQGLYVSGSVARVVVVGADVASNQSAQKKAIRKSMNRLGKTLLKRLSDGAVATCGIVPTDSFDAAVDPP